MRKIFYETNHAITPKETNHNDWLTHTHTLITMSELPEAPLANGGPSTRNTVCDQNYDSTKPLDVTVHCASEAGFGDFLEHLLNSDNPVVQAKLQERLERMQRGNTDAVANTRVVRLSLSTKMPPSKSIDRRVAGTASMEVLAADSDMAANLTVANFSEVTNSMFV